MNRLLLIVLGFCIEETLHWSPGTESPREKCISKEQPFAGAKVEKFAVEEILTSTFDQQKTRLSSRPSRNAQNIRSAFSSTFQWRGLGELVASSVAKVHSSDALCAEI